MYISEKRKRVSSHTNNIIVYLWVWYADIRTICITSERGIVVCFCVIDGYVVATSYIDSSVCWCLSVEFDIVDDDIVGIGNICSIGQRLFDSNITNSNDGWTTLACESHNIGQGIVSWIQYIYSIGIS
jgi:hypothetical protein